MSTANPRLIFVYNAKRGKLQGFLDTIHKTISPDTYECDLCAITYGAFSMDKKWKAWLQTVPLEKVFHYRKDFYAEFRGMGMALPAILLDRGGELETLISAAAFKRIDSVNGLIEALEGALRKAGIV